MCQRENRFSSHINSCAEPPAWPVVMQEARGKKTRLQSFFGGALKKVFCGIFFNGSKPQDRAIPTSRGFVARVDPKHFILRSLAWARGEEIEIATASQRITCGNGTNPDFIQLDL